jgi:hypothetical protein
MDYFSSIWFRMSLGIVALMAIYGIAAFFMVNKNRTTSISIEEKLKLTQALPKAISICKIVILLLPAYLFLIPPIHALDAQLSYEIIAGLTIMYIGSLEGFLLSKRLLNALG